MVVGLLQPVRHPLQDVSVRALQRCDLGFIQFEAAPYGGTGGHGRGRAMRFK
jgi:hypothetical protein